MSSAAMAQNAKREESDKRAVRLEDPKIKELFAMLVYPDAKRDAEMKKHPDNEKLIEVLEKRVVTLQALLDEPEVKQLFDNS